MQAGAHVFCDKVIMSSVLMASPHSAMYGMMHITGDRGGGPVKPGVAVTDVLTGG